MSSFDQDIQAAAKATDIASSFVLFGKWRMSLVRESKWCQKRQGLKSHIEAILLRPLLEGFRNKMQGLWLLKRSVNICIYSSFDFPCWFNYLTKAPQNIMEILVFPKFHQLGFTIFKIMILQLEKILPFFINCCPSLLSTTVQAWVVWSRALRIVSECAILRMSTVNPLEPGLFTECRFVCEWVSNWWQRNNLW